MLQVLYTDYCDATFYFGFIECDPSTVPLMSDDFDVMLSKLNNLRWDILANVQNVPGGEVALLKIILNICQVFHQEHQHLLDLVDL